MPRFKQLMVGKSVYETTTVKWGSDGVCECDKQTEHPRPAGQKTPSVTVTWGWGSYVLTADLGNNVPLSANTVKMWQWKAQPCLAFVTRTGA